MKQHNNHPAWLIRPASSKAPALASIYSMHSSAGAMDKSQTVKAAAKHSASSRLVSTLKRALSGHSLFVAQAASTEVQEGGAASPGCDPKLPSECAAGVRVAILVDHAVAWGERVAVVGQDAVLGAWQAASCVPLAWSEGDVWRAELGLPPGLHEFKCVTIKSDGKLEWEVGSNRVIQVPAEVQAGGLLEARCRWADTANTTLASSDDGDTAADASESGAAAPTDSSTGRSSSSMSDAFRTCSSESADSTGIRSHQLAVTASDCGESQRSSSYGGGGAAQQAPPAAAAAVPPRLPPQQPAPAGGNSRTLTAASLKEAAAAAEAHGSSSSGAAASGGRRGGAVRPSSCTSSSPFSALTGPTAASSLLSPLGTDVTGALPGRGASSSALSYSDLEVSDEAALDESEAGGLTEGLASSEVDAAEAVAAAAAGGMVLAAQQLLDNAAVYQQLMAVEPELLLQQQQQQLIQQQAEATLQAVRSVSSSPASSAFKVISPAAAAESQELLDAVAELCDLSSVVDAALLLPSEETLPPTALTKFAVLAEIQEVSDDEELQLELEEDCSSSACAAAAPAGPAGMDDNAVPDVPPARRDSSSSSCSRLSKDQLPILGLTVNVPSAAAAAAAQMSAANQAAAAAAAAAAKARTSYTGEAPELPVATKGLRLTMAAHCIPHVDKTHTGGEDAFFISAAGHGALGVSDGVSAWAEDGIDPGEYSRTLAAYCAEAYEERVIAAAAAASSGGFISRFDPRALLRYAQQCTCKPGSATMVLAALQPGGQLHVANLGDCGVKVVRQGRVVLETKPQQHDFNLPYQLSHPQLFPDTDTADSADRYTWQLREGDVIVAASDGLFDNMWDDELVALLQHGLLGIQPLEPPASLSRADSLSSIGGSTRGANKMPGLRGRHSRSSSTSQLPALTSAPSTGSLPVFAASAAAAEGREEGGADARAGGMPRSRSTSQLSNWGAKQLRKWKGGASHSKLVSLPATAEAADAAAAAQQGGEQRPQSPAEVGLDAIARAAELLAAAAAAHAGDKEFKSPWSVAAGRAYGLLARLFAKGGKMDDITCVVAVVQDAERAAAAAAGGQSMAASDVSGNSGSRDQVKGCSGSSDSSSSGAPCLTSEGSGVSAAVIDELHQ